MTYKEQCGKKILHVDLLKYFLGNDHVNSESIRGFINNEGKANTVKMNGSQRPTCKYSKLKKNFFFSMVVQIIYLTNDLFYFFVV